MSSARYLLSREDEAPMQEMQILNSRRGGGIIGPYP